MEIPLCISKSVVVIMCSHLLAQIQYQFHQKKWSVLHLPPRHSHTLQLIHLVTVHNFIRSVAVVINYTMHSSQLYFNNKITVSQVLEIWPSIAE